MKRHRTIKITAKLLREHTLIHACEDGLNEFDDVLPLMISTDPDANVDLAIRLIPFNSSVGFRVFWLANKLRREDARELSYSVYFQQDLHGLDGEHDPTIAAQMLAMIADALLSEKGL